MGVRGLGGYGSELVKSGQYFLSLCRSPGDSSPSFYAGDEAGFFVFNIPQR